MNKHIYDLTIIGGGPVGMFATFYAGLRNGDVQLVESLPQLGGQTMALYPEKEIYDVAGFPSIKGKKLIQQLASQLQTFKPDVKLGTSVDTIEKEADYFRLDTNKGATYTKAVIVAIGNGAFAPRKLAFDYDPALEGNYVNYFVQNINDFKNMDVAVAGGGDSAIDWALALEPVAKSVTIIHRRDKFRGLESSVSRLMNSTINIKTPFLLDSLSLNNNKLSIDLKRVKSDEHQHLQIDKLLVNYGFTSDSRILRKWDLKLKGADVAVDSHMQTSRSLIYSVGDSASYSGKAKLIATGFGEVPNAVNHALETLYPDRRQPLHSTSLEI